MRLLYCEPDVVCLGVWFTFGNGDSSYLRIDMHIVMETDSACQTG